MTKTFNTAELMLQGRCIYHLGLAPEELADIVICVGDPDRVAQISQRFEQVEIKKQHREFITHTGYFNDRRLSVISTGIGVDNTEIFMNELDALVNIDFTTRQVKPIHKSLIIIRLGTSGSLHHEIPLGSFIISNYAIGLDTLLNFYPISLSAEEKSCQKKLVGHLKHVGKILHPYVVKGCPQLLACLQADCHQGITVTAPGFFAAQGRYLRMQPVIPDLLQRFRSFTFSDQNIVNIEMETSSLYSFGDIMDHHCLSITTAITNRITGEMSSHPAQAVENLIQTMLPRIAALPLALLTCQSHLKEASNTHKVIH